MRYPSERMGTGRMTGEMRSFSDWINSQALVDLPLKGASFTWSNNHTTLKVSRPDRFLVSNDWVDLYLEVCLSALLKPALYHCPVLLDSNQERRGLAPFRFELM